MKSLSLVRLAEVIGHCLRATRFLKCDFVVEDYWFTWYVHFPRESSLLGFIFVFFDRMVECRLIVGNINSS